MSFLIPEWKKTTVALGIFEDKSITSFAVVDEYQKRYKKLPNNQLLGTGTLIMKDGYHHIITCKHVVDVGGDSMFALLPNVDKKTRGTIILFKEYQTKLGIKWLLDDSCDLALSLFLVNPERWDIKSIPTDLFCQKKGLQEGWDVFYIGYPAKQIGTNLQPVIRSGMLSLIHYHGKHRMIIDALAAGGNSGGPVFLKPIPIGIENAPSMPLKTPFIGFLSQTLENVLDLTPFDRLKYVAGLSIVVSADAVIDLLQSTDYTRHLTTAKKKAK